MVVVVYTGNHEVYRIFTHILFPYSKDQLSFNFNDDFHYTELLLCNLEHQSWLHLVSTYLFIVSYHQSNADIHNENHPPLQGFSIQSIENRWLVLKKICNRLITY